MSWGKKKTQKHCKVNISGTDPTTCSSKNKSIEEKRTCKMEIFSKVKDVYQLKDREKIAPKEKSITTVLLKEILLCLVDGSMVILQVKLFRHGNILSWRLQSLRETKSLKAHRKD